MNNVYEIIEAFNNSDIKKRLNIVKNEIRNDEICKALIKKFNNAKELYEKYNYKDEFISAKKELLDNKLLKEYIDIQNEINMLIMYINSKINDITKAITK